MLEQRGLAGYAYGESSTFHIYLAARPGPWRGSRAALQASDAATLKGMSGEVIRALQDGFRTRGVELMSYNGGMTSAAHTEADVDATIGAFADIADDLVERGLVAVYR